MAEGPDETRRATDIRPESPVGVYHHPEQRRSERRVRDFDRRTDEIRTRIRRTRAEMGQTIQALQHRLAPEEVARRATEAVRRRTTDTKRRLSLTIRRNSTPIAGAGAALALLVMWRIRRRWLQHRTWRRLEELAKRSSHGPMLPLAAYGGFAQPRYEYPEYPQMTPEQDMPTTPSPSEYQPSETPEQPRAFGRSAQMPPHYGETGQRQWRSSSARRFGRGVSRRMQDVGHYASQTASNLSHQVHDRTQHARQWASDIFEDYPLAIGAALFAVGLALGFGLPATRRENRLMGSARDRMVSTARRTGSDLVERGKHAAQHAAHAATATLREDLQTQSRSDTPESSPPSPEST